jgi:hypothetical protein
MLNTRFSFFNNHSSLSRSSMMNADGNLEQQLQTIRVKQTNDFLFLCNDGIFLLAKS